MLWDFIGSLWYSLLMRLVWWLLYRNALYGFQMVKLRSDYTGSHHHSANAMFLNLLQQTRSLKCFFVLRSVREEGADPFSRLNLCNYSGKCSSLWVCLALFYNFATKTFFCSPTWRTEQEQHRDCQWGNQPHDYQLSSNWARWIESMW